MSPKSISFDLTLAILSLFFLSIPLEPGFGFLDLSKKSSRTYEESLGLSVSSEEDSKLKKKSSEWRESFSEALA